MSKNISAIEHSVSSLIAEVLHMDTGTIDQYDNLIELGVDSLLMIDINSVLEREYGVQIQVSQFFGGINTIADISKYIDEHGQEVISGELESAEANIISPSVVSHMSEVCQGSQANYPLVTNGAEGWREAVMQQVARVIYQTGSQDHTVPELKKSVTVDQKPPVRAEKTVHQEGNQEKQSNQKKPYVAYKKIDTDRRVHSQKVKKAIEELKQEYNTKTKTSKKYAENMRMKHADWRNVAGFRQDYKELLYQLVTKDCHDSKIIDVDGNEYIDIAMGFGVNFFGYKPDFVIDAIKKEADKGFPLSMISENIGEVSDLLCELTGMERVAYFNSGSEAVMAAVRIARAKTLKKKIVYFSGAYHGTFDGVLGIKGKDYKSTRPMAVGILENMIEDVIVLDYDDPSSLKIIKDNKDSIAGVLIESVQSRNPGLQPREFVKELRRITSKNDIALIFDEIITGFRISAGGAQEFYGVKADIATYGKIVGGGMPIGVVAGIADYMDCFDGGMWNYGDNSYPPQEAHRTFVGGTFCHHPLSMAAAKAVLTKIKEEKDVIYPEINRRTKFLADELNKFFCDESVPMKVTYFGSLFRFEYEGNLEVFYYYMLSEGIYIWEGRNCFLSTAHSDADINQILDAVKSAIQKMQGVFLHEPISKLPLEVSNQQNTMIMGVEIEEDSSQFIENAVFETTHHLDEIVFEESVRKIVNRHEMMNVKLGEDNMSFEQITEPFALTRCTYDADITDRDIRQFIYRPFDVYSDRGFKLGILKGIQSKYIVLAAHHLFMDGYSLVQMMKEVMDYYNAAVGAEHSLNLKPVMQISEFESKKEQLMNSLNKEEVQGFWSEYLDDAYDLILPNVNNGKGRQGNRVSKQIGKVEYLELKKAAAELKSTPFALMLSVAHILMNKVSGQKKVALGVPFAGQLIAREHSVVGYIDKIVPVVADILPEFRAKDIISQNMRIFGKLNEYHYAFEEICEEKLVLNSPEINVLFNMDIIPQLQADGVNMSYRSIPNGTVMYDLMMNLSLMDNEITIDFDYNSDKFLAEQVRLWLDGYVHILTTIIQNVEVGISGLNCIDYKSEEAMILSVKDHVDANKEFDLEVKKSGITEASYVIVDSYHNLVPLGSVGIIGLYTPNKELFITPFYGRINGRFKLEIMDHTTNILRINGTLVSKSKIEQAIMSVEGVTEAHVYMEDRVIKADVSSSTGIELKRSVINQVCSEMLTRHMWPSQIFIVKNGERILLESVTYGGKEKEICKICEQLLDCDQITAEDDLLEFGMNSFKMLRLFSVIEEKYGVRILFTDLKDNFRIRAIVDLIDHTSANREEKIVPVSKSEYYTASAGQKRLYVEYQHDKESVVYNIPAVIRFEHKIENDMLMKALQQIIERHEILRTYFSVVNGEVVQVLSNDVEIEFDIQETGRKELDQSFINAQMEAFVQPFVLEKLPLIRARVLNVDADETVLLFDVHHILFDGYSAGLLMNELIEWLKGEALPELKVQYKDYATWTVHNEEKLEQQEEYWKNKFPNGIPECRVDSDQTDKVEGRGDCIIDIENHVNKAINNLCYEFNCTPAVLLLSAFSYTLKKHINSDNVLFGVTLEGRNQFQLQDMIGFFVTNLPFYTEIEDQLTIQDYIKLMKDEFYDLIDHSDLPLTKIIEMCGKKRNDKSKKVFDINFAYQNNDQNYALHNNRITTVEYSVDANMFDLDCEVSDWNGAYSIRFRYDKSLLLESTVTDMMQHMSRCLESFISDADVKLSMVNLLSHDEKETLVTKYNATDAEYPAEMTIIELFEEQARLTPDRTAVEFGSETLTYHEFNERANNLAHRLREMGIGRNDFVAIAAERSIEMLVGIYGILKAGGAYIPIDIAYPKERISFMLEDSHPKAVVVYHSNIVADVPVIDLEDPNSYSINNENPDRISGPDDLVYCIYTSGTTGTPKGVMIENRGLTNYITWAKKMYVEDQNEVFPFYSSLSFDLTVTTIFTPLISGGKLLVYTDDDESEYVLYRIMRDNQCTVIKLTPAHLSLIKDQDNTHSSVKRFIVGGEELKVNLARDIHESCAGNIDIYNEYGPTETVVGCMIHKYDTDEDKRSSVPIGRPADNVQIYILDKERNPVPRNVLGEMYIAGDGVARGYLNRPELTSEKFVENPFKGDGKLYRTGDLAKFIEDNRIEYAGRIDEQIKVRGFRIELGEIESRILEIENIKECAVTAKTDKMGDKAIFAYYVADDNIVSWQIRENLRKTLPAYMIPQYITRIEKIPVTRNGKVDKAMLPDIEQSEETSYTSPSNIIEETLCEVFAEVLNTAKVGVHDSFFDLGGHSLSALKAINMIEKKMGLRFNTNDLFNYQTVAGLSKKLITGNEQYTGITKANEQEEYEMSSVQRRLYALSQSEDETLPYNMPGSIEFDETFDVERMRRAVTKLVERHEILRTNFDICNGEPVQIINPIASADFNIVTSEEDITDIYERFVRPFDMKEDAMIRFLVVNVSQKKYILLIDMHHIVSDGISNSLILKELAQLYEGKELPQPEVQYKDYSEWMRTRDLGKQKEYWLKEFSDEVPVLNLPLDFGRGKEASYEGSSLSVETGIKTGKRIKQLAADYGVSEYMIFLSGAMILLSKYSSQEDIIIGSPVSGRTHNDLDQMLGMFVNTLALRGNPKKEITYARFLQHIKEICMNAYDHQDYPFEDLIDEIDVVRDRSRNPLFDVMLGLKKAGPTEFMYCGKGLAVKERECNISKFDLTFDIEELEESDYKISLEYCTALFRRESVERMAEHLVIILEQLSKNPDMKLEQIEMITQAEKELITGRFNDTQADSAKDKTAVEYFEEQVKKTPDRIAVVDGEGELTYQELNERANMLAYRLRELGVSPNDFVPIVGERCNELLVGLYGILKAGAAYIPVDVNYPNERVEFLIQDSNPKAVILVSDQNMTADINSPIIDLRREALMGNTENPQKRHNQDNYSHCFYTSGTTGKPKGAINMHRGLVNGILWTQSQYPITENDVILQKTTVSFDDSLYELLWGSFFGAKVVMLENEGEKDPEAICKAVEKYKVSVLYFVPTMLTFFTSTVEKLGLYRSIQSLRYVFLSGEVLKPEYVRDFHKISHEAQAKTALINTYGPTEASMGCSYFDCDEDYDEIPVGRPMRNSQIYILQGEQLCGIGVPGEVCVCGIFVGAGYLNREELTKQVFVKNPFGPGMMYHTGDLARWRADGNIIFMGRFDEQIKVHGQRIEIGEIESKIREIEGIKDCTVVARCDNNGSKELHAYYVSDQEIAVNHLRRELEKVIPEFMVPSHMMQIDKIPVTANGKLDKGALPAIQIKSVKAYIEPANTEEKVLQTVFSTILGVSQMSIDDSFFVLGGDSIKAIRIVSGVRDAGYELTVKNILKGQTIRTIAMSLKKKDSSKADQEEITGYVDYMPAQRMFFDENMKAPHHYNQSLFFEFNGHVDEKAAHRSLSELAKHHDALRAVYHKGRQKIRSSTENNLYDLEFIEVEQKGKQSTFIEDNCNRIQQSFDLEHGPFLKVCVFRGEHNDHIFFCIHHLVVDGVSWRIIAEDFTIAYKAALNNKQIKLPAKTSSVRSWTKLQQEYEKSNKGKSEREYWDQIKEALPKSKLQCQKNQTNTTLTMKKLIIEKNETDKLLYNSNHAYGTEVQDLLISALGLTVHRSTGQDRIAIEMEGHGREQFGKNVNVDRTVGFFTSVYPLLITSSEKLADTIISNKEMLRAIPNHGAGYGVLEKITGRADILFNYLGDYNELVNEGDILLGISDHSSGDDISDQNAQANPIIINCYIMNNKLIFELSFTGIFTEELTVSLINELKQALTDVINHCCAIDETVITGSDLGDGNMTNDDIGALNELLDVI